MDCQTPTAIVWDERNLLSSVTGGQALSFAVQYDALTRRENDTAFGAGTNYYLDDKKKVASSYNVNGATTTPYSYVTMPGTGEVLTFTANGVAFAPIHDLQGSTLGLVGAGNTLQTSYTYEPFGKVATSGTRSTFPFLFAGMQLDLTGYYGSYSPSLMHSLSGGTVPYTGAGGGGFGHRPERVPPSRRGGEGHTTALLTGFGCPNGDCHQAASDDQSGDGGGGIISGLVVLGQWLADLFGGGQPILNLPGRAFHIRHMIAALFIGPAFGIVPDNSHPEYPLGWIDLGEIPSHSMDAITPVLFSPNPPPAPQNNGSNKQQCIRAARVELSWCGAHVLDSAAGIGIAAEACSEASPLGPEGPLGCLAIAGGIQLPPVGLGAYHCVTQFQEQVQACGQ